jgi:uncharacterized membrane protein
MIAMVAGAMQFALPKGTVFHRGVGFLWVFLMTLVALSSFWIHEFRMFGPFSAIHILSLIVLLYLVVSVRAAHHGNIGKHKRLMIQLYILALLITGAFTLLPGRTMHLVVFGAP